MEFVNYLKLDFGQYGPSRLVKSLKASKISPFWQEWLDSIESTILKFDDLWVYEYNAMGIGLALVEKKLRPIYIGKRLMQKKDQVKHPLIQLLQNISKTRSDSAFQLIDATGGLLNDTFTLLNFGRPLWTFESNPLLCLLILLDQSLKTHASSGEWHFCPKNFNVESLRNIKDASAQSFCVTVYDPMFSATHRKTLPSHEMQVLGLLNEHCPPEVITKDDWQQILQFSDIVIVKRDDKAPFLFDLEPTYSQQSKLLRWDIYSNSTARR
jgi:hypothetical protein